jgi:heme-degrading monooxygenase HmoA
MTYMLVHHTVRDFKQWKPIFDQHEKARKANGSKHAQVFQTSSDPSDVFILFEWDSGENAKKFAQSDDLKKTMELAGVVGKPHIHFLTEAGTSPA